MALDSQWIRVNTDLFDHPLFDNEAYTKREAWIYLIAKATRRRKVCTCKGAKVTLEPGEMLAGRDFLAKKWHWSPQKVRCFLARLKTEGMIELRTFSARKPAIVSICKYSEYQKLEPTKDRQRTDKGPTPQPDSYKTVTEEDNNPLPPKQGEEDQGVVLPALKKQPRKSFRQYDPFKLNPAETNPEEVGIGWTAEGDLVAFNGVKARMLELSGSEEQLRLDLLAVQSSPKVNPSMNLLMLKSRALGVLGEVVSRRRDSDRRYQQAVTTKREGGAKPVAAPSFLDALPPTSERAEIERRFEKWVETEPGRETLRKYGREASWHGFERMQLRRAGASA